MMKKKRFPYSVFKTLVFPISILCAGLAHGDDGQGVILDKNLFDSNVIKDVLEKKDRKEQHQDFTWEYGVKMKPVAVLYAASNINNNNQQYYKLSYPVIQKVSFDKGGIDLSSGENEIIVVITMVDMNSRENIEMKGRINDLVVGCDGNTCTIKFQYILPRNFDGNNFMLKTRITYVKGKGVSEYYQSDQYIPFEVRKTSDYSIPAVVLKNTRVQSTPYLDDNGARADGRIRLNYANRGSKDAERLNDVTNWRSGENIDIAPLLEVAIKPYSNELNNMVLQSTDQRQSRSTTCYGRNKLAPGESCAQLLDYIPGFNSKLQVYEDISGIMQIKAYERQISESGEAYGNSYPSRAEFVISSGLFNSYVEDIERLTTKPVSIWLEPLKIVQSQGVSSNQYSPKYCIKPQNIKIYTEVDKKGVSQYFSNNPLQKAELTKVSVDQCVAKIQNTSCFDMAKDIVCQLEFEENKAPYTRASNVYIEYTDPSRNYAKYKQLIGTFTQESDYNQNVRWYLKREAIAAELDGSKYLFIFEPEIMPFDFSRDWYSPQLDGFRVPVQDTYLKFFLRWRVDIYKWSDIQLGHEGVEPWTTKYTNQMDCHLEDGSYLRCKERNNDTKYPDYMFLEVMGINLVASTKDPYERLKGYGVIFDRDDPTPAGFIDLWKLGKTAPLNIKFSGNDDQRIIIVENEDEAIYPGYLQKLWEKSPNYIKDLFERREVILERKENLEETALTILLFTNHSKRSIDVYYKFLMAEKVDDHYDEKNRVVRVTCWNTYRYDLHCEAEPGYANEFVKFVLNKTRPGDYDAYDLILMPDDPLSPTTRESRYNYDTYLSPGESWYSANGRYSLSFTEQACDSYGSRCDLDNAFKLVVTDVLSGEKRQVSVIETLKKGEWFGSAGGWRRYNRFYFSDNKFVIGSYRGSGVAIDLGTKEIKPIKHFTPENGSEKSFMQVQNDGNVVLYNHQGEAIWASENEGELKAYTK